MQRIDGHDHEAIDGAIRRSYETKLKPSMIILDTIKGKGCSFAEGNIGNHNMNVSPSQLAEALATLEAATMEAS
ncbi:hypothetical protein MASR2M78_19920 [Treponema sp.]